MIKIFIDRPVLSTVISIIIVALGVIGLATLPVEQYPNIAPPTINISANYSGANADVVMNSVVIPIEEQVNGVEGMTYMTSTAMNNGMASISIYFEQGYDPDIAAVNVQNLAARATPLLPQEVVQTGVVVKKQQSSNIMFLAIKTDNPDYDRRFIQNYANINLIPQIRRVYGVADASVFGAEDYSMRVWLKPDVMTAYELSPSEIIGALRDQNIEAAPGELGQNSEQTFQYTLKYTGRYNQAEQFEDIIIRSNNNHILRLKDVAKVELASLNYSVLTHTDNYPSVAIGISQTAGSNAQEVINNVLTVVKEAEGSFPPGVEMVYMMNANEFLDASIKKVITTLIEAFILVFLVVLLFLQDFKSTIIPAVSIPVSIIGTFFFLQMFGFSVNLLTLFALLLAIGIVVDDAIVVVEAVHAQLDAGEKDPRIATINAMKEITPAIVSITLVMASVFIPVSFMPGTTGIFYKQFGLTLAVAIGISAINALTLSPALCALFLKPHKEEDGQRKSFVKRFYYTFNLGFNSLTRKYRSSLQFLGKRGNRWITIAIIGVSMLIIVVLMRTLPKDFVPSEDSGAVMAMIELQPGTSLEKTQEIVEKVTVIADGIPEILHVTNITGVNFMSGIGSSYASLIIKMVPWDQRKLTAAGLAAQLTEATKDLKDASFMFFGTPTLQGFGMSAGVEMQLQDRTGGNLNDFFGITNNFLAEMRKNSDLVLMTKTSFDDRFPQKEIHANIAKIKEAGLTLTEVMTTMQAYVGSMYISNFNLYGKQYRVMMQAEPEDRKRMEDMDKLHVKTGSGKMAPITEFLTFKDITGPQTISRFNMFSSMDITIIPNFFKGASTGDVIKLVEEIGTKTLPQGFAYEYSGMSREQVKAGDEILFIFLIIILFVYLLLSALYESYIIPLAVIFSIPVGIAGVFLAVMVCAQLGTGIVFNIYVQISIVMLIGLLAKNAILIVEYAVQRRQQGMSVIDAAVNGAVARFRPILMTSFAFIFGLLPLAMASGAGAVGNRSIGISAVSGMFIGTMIGVLVIPSLYIIFQVIQDKISGSGMINTQDEVVLSQLKDKE